MVFALWAGSQPSGFMTEGMAAPDSPAKERFSSIPRPATRLIFYQNHLFFNENMMVANGRSSALTPNIR